MKSYIKILLFIFSVLLVSCPVNDETTSSRRNSGKITSLAQLINEAKETSTINLKNYHYITDFNANIHKSINIIGDENKTNFRNAKLNVMADNVLIQNVSNCNIDTHNFLKISNSSLNNLQIKSSGGRSNSDSNAIANVEIDNSIIDDLDIKLDNSVISIKDKSTAIAQISSSNIATIYFEDGTSDKINAPKVSDNGEVTYINSKVSENDVRLIALTPYSGLKTQFKIGEKFDLSDLIMLGTYESTDKGATVYRANNISYQMKSTFSKLEKIEPQANVPAGAYDKDKKVLKETIINVTVSKADVEFTYQIAFVGETSIFDLQNVVVTSQPNKIDYLQGEKLDLSGLVVKAHYVNGSYSYDSIISDYQTDIPNGTKLTEIGTKTINVTFDGKKCQFDVNVSSAYVVTYIVDQSNDTQNIVKYVAKGNKAVEIVNLVKNGKTFIDWYEDKACTNEYDFTKEVNANLTLYAKWFDNANNFIITYMDKNNLPFSGSFNGVAEVDYPTTHHWGKETNLVSPTRVGYEFRGWHKNSDCSDNAITVVGSQDFTSNFSLYADWIPNKYIINYKDAGDLDLLGTFTQDYPTYHTYGCITTLVAPTKDENEFVGWYKTNNCSDNPITTIGATEITSDITLYAKWAKGYLDASGDFVVNGVRCKKTSMIEIINPPKISCMFDGGCFVQGRDDLTLNSFGISKYMITQELYQAVVGSNPSINTSDLDIDKGETNKLLRPVENVTWVQATEFCNALSELMGYSKFYNLDDTEMPYDLSADGYRLPFESEWECAGRGNQDDYETWFYDFAGAETADDVAWTQSNAVRTVEVGLKAPNILGLYDMSGNLFEMCSDFFGDVKELDVYGLKSGEIPQQMKIVLRSGSYYNTANTSKLTNRQSQDKNNTDGTIGFRIACFL